MGHAVEIVTRTPGKPEWEGLPVHRCLNVVALRQKVRAADLYLQNHISLRSLWPAAACGTKIVVLHQTYLWPWDGRAGIAGRIKALITRRLRNLAISQAVASALPANTPITGNPYDAATFYRRPELARERDIAFVGRLVSDKGVDVLFSALKSLRENALLKGRKLRVSVAGAGPDEAALRTAAADLPVIFLGQLQGDALAEMLNQHRILVIPSLWPEPFGIVALEGAACGCRVIGSDQGGLPEAIGPCGSTFPNGDASALAECILQALDAGDAPETSDVRDHLLHHAPDAFAQRILKLATE
jgi:glycosyltransferase involved in cell wall biosynthesis